MDNQANSVPPTPWRLRIAVVLSVIPLLAGLFAGCGATVQSASGKTAATAAPTATSVPLHLNLYTHITSIAMLSPTNGWAVGYGSTGASYQIYLLRYQHGAWTTESNPLPDAARSFAPHVIAMVSPTEGWIGGDDHNDAWNAHGAMLHGVEGRWTPVTLPAHVGPIESIAMVSPDEGWAITSPSQEEPSQILHYAQGAWTVSLSVPNRSQLLSVVMTSPADGWVAGIGYGALWHYSNGSWRHVTLNDPQHADLERISMLSPDEGWGIGSIPLPTSKGDAYAHTWGAIWHYSGGQWQVAGHYEDDPRQFVQMSTLQAVAPGDIWASETDTTGKRFLHYANGTLQTVPAPIRDGINSIAMVSPSEGWAVGAAGQILHYANGSWTDYPTQ